MCVCRKREEENECTVCAKKTVRQCAHVKVIASKAEMKFRFVRTSSRSMQIIKSYEKCVGGGEEQKKDSQ